MHCKHRARMAEDLGCIGHRKNGTHFCTSVLSIGCHKQGPQPNGGRVSEGFFSGFSCAVGGTTVAAPRQIGPEILIAGIIRNGYSQVEWGSSGL